MCVSCENGSKITRVGMNAPVDFKSESFCGWIRSRSSYQQENANRYNKLW